MDCEYALHMLAGETIKGRLKPIRLAEMNQQREVGRSAGKGLALYVHIPFCEQVCSFCAFHRTTASPEKIEGYIGPFSKHLDTVLPQVGRGKITSVYFGGGTSGLLTLGQADQLLANVRQNVETNGARITFELHPKNATENHVLGLLALGVSRLSLGVQNLSDQERQGLDRNITSAQQEVQILQNLNQIGVPYNIDLMFGTPNQTQQSLENTLIRVVEEVNPPEITLFQYVNAYGARSRNLINQGVMRRPGLHERHQMYDMARNYLVTCGYNQTGTYGFSREKDAPQRKLMNNGVDFMGLGPRVYSRIGNIFAMNNARVGDFLSGQGKTENYYGLRVPVKAETFIGKTLVFLAERRTNTTTKSKLNTWRSEGITQVYSVMYYLLNQPSLSK